MKKLPVLTVISRTLGFLLGDLPTIVRLAWLPLALAALASFYLGGQAIDAMVAAKGKADAATGNSLGDLAAAALSFVANVMVLVALLRVVMYGDRKPGMPAWAWFGVTEARFVLVYILLLVAALAAVIGTVLILGLVAAIASGLKGGLVLTEIAFLGAFGTMMWAFAKLFILPAVIVAEGHMGVERSWALMRGNGMRMLLVLLMIFVPLAITEVAISLAVLGNDLPPFPDLSALSDGKLGSSTVRQAMEQWQVEVLAAVRLHWLEFTVLNFVGAIVGAAAVAGIAGNAYLALADESNQHNVIA